MTPAAAQNSEISASGQVIPPQATESTAAAGTPGDVASGEGRPRILVLGDSTAKVNPKQHPLQGWGQAMTELLAGHTEVLNFALYNASSRSFYTHPFIGVLNQARPGDIALISFGHNDQNMMDPDKYTSPEEFRAYLELFADTLRELGVSPVFVTSLARGTFHADGRVANGLRERADLMVKTAAEVAVTDRVADVERGEAVLPAGVGAVLQIDRGDDQEQDLQERLAEQQRETRPGHLQEVSGGEAGGQQDPEADLADDDQRDDHDGSPFGSPSASRAVRPDTSSAVTSCPYIVRRRDGSARTRRSARVRACWMNG